MSWFSKKVRKVVGSSSDISKILLPEIGSDLDKRGISRAWNKASGASASKARFKSAERQAQLDLLLQQDIFEYNKQIALDQAAADSEEARKKREEEERLLNLKRAGRRSTIHTIDEFNRSMLGTGPNPRPYTPFQAR